MNLVAHVILDSLAITEKKIEEKFHIFYTLFYSKFNSLNLRQLRVKP